MLYQLSYPSKRVVKEKLPFLSAASAAWAKLVAQASRITPPLALLLVRTILPKFKKNTILLTPICRATHGFVKLLPAGNFL